jgi:hypothetical protein
VNVKFYASCPGCDRVVGLLTVDLSHNDYLMHLQDAINCLTAWKARGLQVEGSALRFDAQPHADLCTHPSRQVCAS